MTSLPIEDKRALSYVHACIIFAESGIEMNKQIGVFKSKMAKTEDVNGHSFIK